jgi:tetratricopeptide (TPR) repeat protein
MKKGFVKEGLKMLESSRSFFLNHGDNALISQAFNHTGLCYLLLSDFQKAKDNFNTSIKFGDDAQDKTMKFMALINLAQCHYLSGDTISAQLYAKSYMTLSLKNEKYESAANANSFLGQIALDQKKNNLAMNYFEKQAEYAEKTKSPFTISRAKNNLAISLFFKGETEHSLSLFQEVLQERKDQGVIPYLCDAYLNIGSLYIESKDYEIGNIYLDSSIFLAKNNNLLTNQIEALETKLEFDDSQALKDEVRKLKGNQKLILAEQRKLRNIKSSVTVNRGSISTWPWYSYLIFIFIPIVVVLFFKNSLSDKG